MTLVVKRFSTFSPFLLFFLIVISNLHFHSHPPPPSLIFILNDHQNISWSSTTPIHSNHHRIISLQVIICPCIGSQSLSASSLLLSSSLSSLSSMCVQVILYPCHGSRGNQWWQYLPSDRVSLSHFQHSSSHFLSSSKNKT